MLIAEKYIVEFGFIFTRSGGDTHDDIRGLEFVGEDALDAGLLDWFLDLNACSFANLLTPIRGAQGLIGLHHIRGLVHFVWVLLGYLMGRVLVELALTQRPTVLRSIPVDGGVLHAWLLGLVLNPTLLHFLLNLSLQVLIQVDVLIPLLAIRN